MRRIITALLFATLAAIAVPQPSRCLGAACDGATCNVRFGCVWPCVCLADPRTGYGFCVAPQR